MKIRNFRAISFLLPLFACLFSFLPVLTNAAAEPAEEISISTNEVRPVSDFKIAVPAANAGQLIENMEAENSRLVEIDYSQFLKLAEKNNRLISEKCEVEKLKRQLKNRKKALPADCVISRASYRFAKKGENIFCDLNMDISVLNDKNFLTIPVLGGRIAITDARLDDTAPVMMVEPINFTEYKNTSGHQMAGNDYSLILKGKGDHRLCVKFMLAPEKSDATNFFRINTANSPENSVVFLHDERYASVKMEPCVGLRLFTHPGSGNRAMEGHFGVSDSLLISYFTITDEEMKRAENAAKAEVKTGGTEEAAVIGGVSGILKHPDPLSVKKNETRASFKCSVKTIFSFGDETILGKHELNFKVIKGGVARFSLGLAPGMDIDEVLSNNFDRMLVRELKSGSSVEILLKTAAEKDFSITLKTVTKIQDSAREAGLPELQIQDAESERGYIAVCAFSNVKIEISKEPLNLERVDAYEMPEDMRYSTVSPVLYAFKYFRHPYKADMALTRYSDAEALSTLITASSINTVVTPDGTAVSKISIDMKNNGMPFLKMIPAGTCEILESNVNLRPVKTSVDSSSNFRIPIIRSEIKNENVGDFPVRIKTSSDIDKLSSYVGLFKIKMPRVDLPMMSFEWRIFVPDGFVFFDMNGSPGLKQPTPFMVFYQIPVNIVIAVSNILYSDNFWHFLIFIGMIIFIASFAYASYFGIEKAAAAFANIWDCLYYAGAAIINAVNFAKLGVALIFLWVLAAVCTPQFAAMTEDAKSTKAKQDCDTLAQAVQKYNSLEGGVVRDAFMKELKGKYLTNLDTLKDPWGNRYELDIQRGVVFSKGADGKTGTKDDITVFYADPTALEPDANTGGNDKKASVADARKIAETASRKGVFSVPVNLVKTNTFYLLNKKFVMPDQDIFLNISYMTSGVYMFLCALLMISGALLPYFLGGAIEFDRRFALMVSAVLSIIFVIETVNMYIPQTAKYPQIGLLCGTILLIALKFISFISDPDIYRTFFRTFIAAKTQDQKSKSETAHDAAVTSLLTVLAVSIMLSALCGMPHRAFAADLKSNELYYNPSTLEVQLFQLNGLDRFFSKRYSKGVFVKYADLKFLLDSVSAIDKGGASIKLPESAVEPERAPYKNLVKKMLISCNATAGNADIDIEYLIDIFDDDYTSVRLFSGNIALTGVSSRLIRTFAGTSEIAVSGYDAVRILPFKDTYSAVFGGPGEYLVKVSLKADIAADKDDRYFDIAPGKCPAMKINLRTPAGYDISASGLIIESQKQESSTSEIATSANLIPADFYRFRLTLQEKIRNEKYRKQRELEERAKKARELIARSEAVKSVIPKSEPRTAVNSVQILTVEEERFSSVITLNYNIENTELRDLRFKIRPETLITRVGSSAEISDWKIADAADAADAADDKQNKILCVTFRTPQKGRLDLTIDFEHVIADMKREAEAPWLIPQAVDENVLYLALDSAVNADLSVTRTENLTAIDEREIPGGLKRNTLSPVLFSYKTSKFPCALALSIKKNTDLPSIPCVIDSAAYKSFVTKAGYVLTSARYQVRNNNVQFLRMRLPESSKAWSLKVGERLVKPAKNEEGSIFIPLLKSPLIDNEFKAFSVELVYLSKFPEFGDFGGARFSIPMIEVMCSRISWEFYFMDSYQISGIRANLRRSAAAGAAGFMDGGSGKALSVEEMLAVQDKMKAAYLAGGLDDPGMNSEGVSGVFPSSLPQFGGNVRGFLPVSTEFPELATNALFFSGENLKRSEGFDNAPLFFIEFNFYSNKVFEFLAIAGYIMGVLLAVWAASAIFKTKKYRRLIICGSISFIYCLIVFQYNENSMNYLFAGFSMGIIFILAGFAARPAKRAGQ